MIRATTLHNIRLLLGQMLDIEDVDVLVNDSMFRMVYRPLADICSIELHPSNRQRMPLEEPQLLARVRPGETMREDVGSVQADEHSVVRICEIWAWRVTKEREAIEEMKPLLATQKSEADCYARLAGLPDRMRTHEESDEFRERLAVLEEKLSALVNDGVTDPEERAENAEVVHSDIQKLERRSAVVGIRRSVAFVWAFVISLVGDLSKVASLMEHIEKISKFLPP